MTGLNVDRVDWFPERALRGIDGLAHRADERAGERLREAAQRGVPYDTGELADSAELVVTDEGAAVGYTAEHAPFVHAKGRALGGRDAHWLESAIESDASEIGGVYEDTLRSGWPSG